MEDHRNRTRRVFTEVYTPERIERLKSIIRDFQQQGNGRRYCILVDGEMVVPVNTDENNFDNYQRYINAHTETVEVRMFFGKSPNCNRHVFHTKPTSLNGTPEKDIEQRIKEALQKQKMETQMSLLKRELKRKNKKLRQYKVLQAELDEKKIDIKELISKGIELYGQFNANQKGVVAPGAVEGTPPAEVEVHIEPESKADKHYQQMKGQYSEKELEKALKTWEIFAAYPQLREEFNRVITQKINDNGEA